MTGNGIALALLFAASVSDRDIPHFNVDANCAAAGNRTVAAKNACIREEQGRYDLANQFWLMVSPRSQKYCVSLADRAKPYEYTGLEVCLSARYRIEQSQSTPHFQYH